MEIQWLTPEELEELDPTGKGRLHLKRFKNQRFEKLPQWYKLPDGTKPCEFLQRFHVTTLRTLKPEHQEYASLLIDHESKLGRQGGTFPLRKLKEIVLPYWTNVERTSPYIVPQLYMARDFLLRRIRRRLRERPLQIAWIHSAKRTCSGLPFMGHRGDFNAESLGMKPGWRHALPAVPGERFMRGKPRSIFMLANPDFRYVECQLTSARNWLKEQFPEYFGAWLRPDLVIVPTIASALRRHHWSVEEDYINMDMCFSWHVVRELILPIYEVLLGDAYLRVAAYIEESFNAPLFWGEEMWTGLHNLLSGLPYTNDFETLYSVILSLAVTLSCNLQEAALLALGDDVTLTFKGSPSLAEKVHQTYVEYTTPTGLLVHDDEKARKTCQSVRFCRKVYYPQGDAYGAYPSTLSLMNILMPETLNPDMLTELAAVMQRLDNTTGSPDYYLLLKVIGAITPDEVRKVIQTADSSAFQVDQDWWDLLYGQVWSAKDSPSYNALRALWSTNIV